jgi:ribosomal protein S1
MWDDAKKQFPIGRRVRGVVAQHQPFGVFIDIGDAVTTGLVQISDFLDSGRMTPEQYPPVGSWIDAVVLGHTDEGRKQIWLGAKPSQLRMSE